MGEREKVRSFRQGEDEMEKNTFPPCLASLIHHGVMVREQVKHG